MLHCVENGQYNFSVVYADIAYTYGYMATGISNKVAPIQIKDAHSIAYNNCIINMQRKSLGVSHDKIPPKGPVYTWWVRGAVNPNKPNQIS